MEGYDIVKCENLFHLNILKLIKIYKQLKEYNFKELYMMEFKKDKEVDFLINFNYDMVYAYKSDRFGEWEKKFPLKLIMKSNGKIIESVYNYAKVIDDKIKKESLKPVLHIKTKESDYITVGVGAGGDYKVASPTVLAEFLNYIISIHPDIKFHILGNGRNQEKYYKELKQIIKYDNIINRILEAAIRAERKPYAYPGIPHDLRPWVPSGGKR